VEFLSNFQNVKPSMEGFLATVLAVLQPKLHHMIPRRNCRS